MRTLVGFITGCGILLAQSDSKQTKEFDVASVRRAQPNTVPGAPRTFLTGGPGTSSPGRITYRNATLKQILLIAYGIKSIQLSGPEWLESEHYDVVATLPSYVSRADLGRMLQSLLADRFGVVVHHETRELRVYELIIARSGAKLRESAQHTEAAAPSDGPEPSFSQSPPSRLATIAAATSLNQDGFPVVPPGISRLQAFTSGGVTSASAQRVTMSGLAGWLGGETGDTVIDHTGLAGEYDFRLRFGPASSDLEPTLIDALPEQLGLSLRRSKAPIDIVVVDRAGRVPKEN